MEDAAMLNDERHFRLMEPHHWLPNSLDLNPKEQNIYQSQEITNLEGQDKIPQEIIDKCI